MPFNNDSDPDLIAKSAAVVQAFTPEVREYLISLLPTSESLTANHDRLITSYTAFLAGGSEKTEEWEADRNTVAQGLTILLGLAKAVTVKDPKAPETIGLGPLHVRVAVPLVPLTKPLDFKVIFDQQGKPVASCHNVKNARGFQVWGCDGDPGIEANWKLVASSVSCRGIEITGLNRANTIWLKMRAVRRKGEAGPWSNLVRLPPA